MIGNLPFAAELIAKATGSCWLNASQWEATITENTDQTMLAAASALTRLQEAAR
jgi:hypothetical protein